MILKHVVVCLCLLVAVACGGDNKNPIAPTPAPAPTPTTAPAPEPDLVVGSPTVNDSSPAVGATFTLSTTVQNDGDGDSPATTLRYYRSTDATITTDDTAEGSAAVEELSPSVSTSAAMQLTAPATAGTYYYGACVDAVADESDTANNCSSSVQVTVREPDTVPPEAQGTPDLVVESSVSDSGPAIGATFTLSTTVQNDGDGDSPATTLRYYRSTDAMITTDDTAEGSAAVEELSPSVSTSAAMQLTAPATAGTYYYGACVDAVADESNTTNNCSSSVQVTVSDPLATTAPDLVVVVVVLSNSGPAIGAKFGLSSRVRNAGDGAAAATTLRYFRSTDATITTDDTAEGSVAVEELSPSVSTSASMQLTAPATAGTYYYGACVDAVADESDTANNCSSSVQVTVRKPDEGVSHCTGSPSAQGECSLWLTPDLITASDPSWLRSVEYAGRDKRPIPNPADGSAVSEDVFLFDVLYEGHGFVEFQIHPEYGDQSEARKQVDMYAPVVGQLPRGLLSKVKWVQVASLPRELSGVRAARDHGIYIAPPRAEEWLHKGFLEEIMLHEGAHVSLDTDHIQAPQWIAAQRADGGFLNTYARDYPNEDIAETTWAYFVTHYRPDRIGARNVETILAAIPNRLAYFDAQRFDMSPYVLRVATVPQLPEPVPALPLLGQLLLALGLLRLGVMRLSRRGRHMMRGRRPAEDTVRPPPGRRRLARVANERLRHLLIDYASVSKADARRRVSRAPC